jgi:hypothetical protein
MKSVRERMDIQSPYREVGTYRGAAEICGVTHKTVKRVVEASLREGPDPEVAHNYDEVTALVAERVTRTKGRISAKRLLPVALPLATPVRPGTSVVSSPTRRRRSPPNTTGDAARPPGRRASTSSSTGARSARSMCSAP